MKNMEKVVLYKYGKKNQTSNAINMLQNDDFDELKKYSNEKGTIWIFKKTINYNDQNMKDKKIAFLEEELVYSENVFVVLIEVDNYLYWFRKGKCNLSIEKYKNPNYPLYYFSNITDYKLYTFHEIQEREFSLFYGESQKNTLSESGTNVEQYVKLMNMYNNLLENFKINVPTESQIGNDLGLKEDTLISFGNGIQIVISTSTEDNFMKIIEIISKISKRVGESTIKRFFKLSKRSNEIKFHENVDLSGLFLVTNKNSFNNMISVKEDHIDKVSRCIRKSIIGFYSHNGKKYFVNLKGEVYSLIIDDFNISSLVSSDHFIVSTIGVCDYKNENDYLDKIVNRDEDNVLIHVFHKNHYIKNKRSKFEICDILIWDKKSDVKYLVFVKYKYTMSSSEVFWQSSFVLKQFESGQIEDQLLHNLFEKVRFPKKYARDFNLKDAKFVNLILPEFGNVNTENLNHIINIWKNSDTKKRMEIVIPKTRKKDSVSSTETEAITEIVK